EALAHGPADPAGAAGDHGDLARQVLDHDGPDPPATAAAANVGHRSASTGISSGGSGCATSSTSGPTRAAAGASASRSKPYTAAALPPTMAATSSRSTAANARRRCWRLNGQQPSRCG